MPGRVRPVRENEFCPGKHEVEKLVANSDWRIDHRLMVQHKIHGGGRVVSAETQNVQRLGQRLGSRARQSDTKNLHALEKRVSANTGCRPAVSWNIRSFHSPRPNEFVS